MNNELVEETDIPLASFLEIIPPGTAKRIASMNMKEYSRAYAFELPDIQLHCEICDGIRIYQPSVPEEHCRVGVIDDIWRYKCRNCTQQTKTFAIRLFDFKSETGNFSLTKIGEVPSFGPPLPSKLISLFREDKDLLIKGRRAENQGLGVGAFAYYRRIVEKQKVYCC